MELEAVLEDMVTDQAWERTNENQKVKVKLADIAEVMPVPGFDRDGGARL